MNKVTLKTQVGRRCRGADYKRAGVSAPGGAEFPAECPQRLRAPVAPKVSARTQPRPTRLTRSAFETATGYSPELLAARAAGELRHLLRLPAFDRRMSAIIKTVTARAARCWAAQPRWRTRWTRAGRAGNAAPLLMFFRHWTAAAARRAGILLPEAVCSGFALGLTAAV